MQIDSGRRAEGCGQVEGACSHRTQSGSPAIATSAAIPRAWAGMGACSKAEGTGTNLQRTEPVSSLWTLPSRGWERRVGRGARGRGCGGGARGGASHQAEVTGTNMPATPHASSMRVGK
jgi:hypothetical protein